MKEKIVILGCGNVLFGDDGFGPAVVEYFNKHMRGLAGVNVEAIDVGTSVRDFLFDVLLSKDRPRKIIVVDSMLGDGEPGEIKEIDLDDISPQKISDFSLHQFPTTNMLKELKENTSVEVKVFVVQVSSIPDEVRPGLSCEVKRAVPDMCELLIKECEG